MAGNDYNNIFSGDYWTEEGRRRRRSGSAEAHKQLAQTQNQNRVNEWDAIGKALGGINKPIGDFFDGLPANRRKREAEANRARKANTTGFKPGAGVEAYASKTKPGPITTLPSKLSTDENRDRAMAGRQGMGPNSVPPMDGASSSQSSLFDELLGKITSDWSGPDKSKIDYSPLDAALNARMGALNSVRDKSQQNFNTSDANLESMHRGFQNHIQTDGSQRFNNIADTQKQNLTASNDIAQNNLQKIKAEDMAKRQAMLQNLGIQAAGAQEDSSAQGLNQAIGSIESREQADVANADQDRASNLAYNQGIATSVGQQGVERRGDLAQQLQTILGRIDMAGADAQAENAQARYQLEQAEGGRQYDQWRDNKGFMQDTLGMLQQDAMEREKLAMQAPKPNEVPGLAGLGQDLLNSGYEVPQVQQGMGVLADIVADDYRKGIDPNAGYTQTDVLMRRLIENGVDRMLAFQLATNYSNMGNTSKYENRPY